MKVKELRGLSTDELGQKEKSFKKELFALNYQSRTGGVEKTHRFKLLRRDIAKINTIIRERELENERSPRTKK